MATKGRRFAGCTVALVTPFRRGQVDEVGLRELVDWHVAQGTRTLSPVGTTGEAPTLSHDEHERVIALVVEAAAGRLQVMPGTGSNSTTEAIRLTHEAGREIGKVVAALVCILNPGVLLVSGDLASSPLIGGIRESLYTQSLPRATRHLDVRLGALGENAAIVGMTVAVVDKVFSAEAVDLRLSD